MFVYVIKDKLHYLIGFFFFQNQGGGWVGVFFIIGGIMTIVLNGFLLIKAELVPPIPWLLAPSASASSRNNGVSTHPVPAAANSIEEGASRGLIR